MLKKRFLAVIMVLSMLAVFVLGSIDARAEVVRVLPFTSPLDYSIDGNWLYDGVGVGKDVDVFIVAPTVDTLNPSNAIMTEAYKQRFRNAMNQQQALYAETSRLYAPYYRQAAMNAYSLDAPSKDLALSNAYVDVSAAFRYYLKNKNNGRPVILAGFSQGADMCYRLLEEFYGGQTEEAVALRNNLVAVYAIGWPLTKEMVQKYPQLVPAKGEDDLGVIITYECEDGNVNGTFIVPTGTQMYAINPLNWKTDSTVASKKLNKGSVTQNSRTGAVTSVMPQHCGAYLDPVRGTLVVTDITPADYPPVLKELPEGAYHLYDNFLFFANLKENIQLRARKYIEKKNSLKESA